MKGQWVARRSRRGAAQLQALDDDYYVRGVLTEGRYRSIRVKLEREIVRLYAVVDAGTKWRIPVLISAARAAGRGPPGTGVRPE